METFAPIILFIGGILGGFYAANVGGGALLSFPLLILTGLSTTNAIATQRFAAVVLELVSALKFHKEKQLNLKVGLFLSLFAIAGAAIGARIVLSINEKTLNLVVSALFLFAFFILLNRDRLKIKEKGMTQKNLVLAAISTFLLSIYGGFFGAGFGFFIIIVLVLLGFNFIKSAAIGRIVGFFMSLTGTIVFAQSGAINLVYGVSLGAGFAIGSWIGIGVALKKGESYIKALLFIIMALTLLKLLADAFGLRLYQNTK